MGGDTGQPVCQAALCPWQALWHGATLPPGLGWQHRVTEGQQRGGGRGSVGEEGMVWAQRRGEPWRVTGIAGLVVPLCHCQLGPLFSSQHPLFLSSFSPSPFSSLSTPLRCWYPF